MRFNFDNSLKTVTVLNKLSAVDSVLKQDTWYKTVLEGCQFDKKRAIAQSGTDISLESVFKIQLPDFTDYLPYREWIADRSKWTMSLEDIIILGEVTEDVTTTKITDIKRIYQPNVCTVKHINDTRNQGITSGNTGIQRFIECLYIEGL